MKRFHQVAVLAFLFALTFVHSANGQSLVTGNIVGTVKDPSGAVVPNAPVDLRLDPMVMVREN